MNDFSPLPFPRRGDDSFCEDEAGRLNVDFKMLFTYIFFGGLLQYINLKQCRGNRIRLTLLMVLRRFYCQYT